MMKFVIVLLSLVIVLNAIQLQRDNSKNVVIDKANSLMWMDGMENISLMLSHRDAKPYCEDLKYADFSDWRLADIKEFSLIVDKKNKINYINRTFKYNQKAGYWAKDAHFRTLWFYADYMHFLSGTQYFDSRFKKKFVRCVRDTK